MNMSFTLTKWYKYYSETQLFRYTSNNVHKRILSHLIFDEFVLSQKWCCRVTWLRPAFKAKKCEMPKLFFVILSKDRTKSLWNSFKKGRWIFQIFGPKRAIFSNFIIFCDMGGHWRPLIGTCLSRWLETAGIGWNRIYLYLCRRGLKFIFIYFIISILLIGDNSVVVS